MSDLIAAISTAPVPAAIGILRLSGPGALEAVDRVFRAVRGGTMAAAPDRKLVYGTLLDRQGRPIDQVLATVSRGPNSYTGEDTAELQCHGSPMVLTLGLEALCAAGAVSARLFWGNNNGKNHPDEPEKDRPEAKPDGGEEKP